MAMVRPTIRIDRKPGSEYRPETSRVTLVLGDQEFEIPVRAIVRRDAINERPLVVIEAYWRVEEVITIDEVESSRASTDPAVL